MAWSIFARGGHSPSPVSKLGRRALVESAARGVVEALEGRLLLAGQVTTIDFDGLTPGTVVTKQFFKQGITLSGKLINETVVAVGKFSHSLANVLNISVPAKSADSFTPDLVGDLSNDADQVGMFVGVMKSGAGPSKVVLTAFNAAGKLVGQTQTVVQDAVFGTFLQITADSSNIRRFELTGSDNVAIGVDDVQFRVTPSFSIAPASTSVTVARGGAVSDVISVSRLFGSTGNLNFTASGLPAGVSVSFSPSAVGSLNTTTALISTLDTAALTSPAGLQFTITATPASASSSGQSQSLAMTLRVVQPFSIAFDQSSLLVVGSTSVGFSLTRGPGFTRSINVGLSGAPANVSTGVTPTFIPAGASPVSGFVAFTPTATASGAFIATLRASTGTLAATGALNVNVRRFQLTSFGPSIGSTPQLLNPGTLVTIQGIGLDLTRQVQFGNVNAVALPVSVNAGGTTLTVRVPRLATTGSLTLVGPNGVTSTIGNTFTVRSFRDMFGYSFSNFSVTTVTFDEMTEAFGFGQTHIFGTPIPDPLALVMWGIAAASLNDGQCFGMSLSAARFEHGFLPLFAFAAQPGLPPTTDWNLQGPGGPTAALQHVIHINHLEQLSGEFLHAYLVSVGAHAIIGAAGGAAAAAVVHAEVVAALSRGVEPIISLADDGGGHAITAYDLEPDPSDANGFFIDVYDSNIPFLASENTDAADHSNRELNSRVHVHGNGTWDFPNLTRRGTSVDWQGALSSLGVVGFDAVPITPHLPTSPNGLGHLIFGTGAQTLQVSDGAGHNLLDKSGAQNADAKTQLPGAAVYFPVHDTNEPSIPIDLLGQQTSFTQTVMGTGQGTYSQTYLDGTFAATVDDVASSKGVIDTLTYDSKATSLLFHTGAKSELLCNGLVVRAADGSDRSATFNLTSFGEGSDRFSFSSEKSSLSIVHNGPATSFSFLLQAVGKTGDGGSFSSGPLSLADGDSATVTVESWSQLNKSAIVLTILHKGGGSTKQVLQNGGAGQTISATAGVLFQGTVSTFTTDSFKPQGKLVGEIDWGDHTSSAGAISSKDGATFVMSGAHTYDAPGTYIIVAHFSDDSGVEAENRTVATVMARNIHTVLATAGVAFTGPVAVVDNADFRPANSNAVINWGDGSVSLGDFTTLDSTRSQIIGGHTFTTAGVYHGTVHVSDSPAQIIGGTTLTIKSGQSFQGTLATVGLPPGTTFDDFQATIYWGDGKSSAAVLGLDANGLLAISGLHTYKQAGLFTPVIQLVGGPGLTLTFTTNVSSS